LAGYSGKPSIRYVEVNAMNKTEPTCPIEEDIDESEEAVV